MNEALFSIFIFLFTGVDDKSRVIEEKIWPLPSKSALTNGTSERIDRL